MCERRSVTLVQGSCLHKPTLHTAQITLTTSILCPCQGGMLCLHKPRATHTQITITLAMCPWSVVVWYGSTLKAPTTFPWTLEYDGAICFTARVCWCGCTVHKPKSPRVGALLGVVPWWCTRRCIGRTGWRRGPPALLWRGPPTLQGDVGVDPHSLLIASTLVRGCQPYVWETYLLKNWN